MEPFEFRRKNRGRSGFEARAQQLFGVLRERTLRECPLDL